MIQINICNAYLQLAIYKISTNSYFSHKFRRLTKIFIFPHFLVHDSIYYIILLLLCSFTPYCYILGSGKEEVLGRGAGLLTEPKYIIYIYILGCLFCPSFFHFAEGFFYECRMILIRKILNFSWFHQHLELPHQGLKKWLFKYFMFLDHKS